MKKLLFLGVLTIFISACATQHQFKFNVMSKTISNGLPEKHNCIILYENEDEKTIEGKFYIPQLEAMLKSKGINIVNEKSDNPDCVISVLHKTTYGKEQEIGYTFGQTGVSSSTSYTNASASAYSIGNTAYGYGQATTYTNYTPTYGITGTYTYDVPRMYNIFSILAVDSKNKEEIWKINVFYAGSTKDKWEELFELFNCILSKYLFINFDNYIELSREELDKIYNGQCNEMWSKRSFIYAKDWATKNNADAQYNLALKYLFGEGTDKDIKKAFYWAEKAAENGNSEAQVILGNMYIEHNNDKSTAFYWFSKAAYQGTIDKRKYDGVYIKDIANYRIANMYYTGDGVEQNLKKAMEIYSSLPYDSFAVAEAKVACYDKNINTIQEHFEKCLAMAKQGNSKAQYAIVSAYYNGYGVEKDIDKAYEWLLKAIKKDAKYKSERFSELIMEEVKNKNSK